MVESVVVVILVLAAVSLLFMAVDIIIAKCIKKGRSVDE